MESNQENLPPVIPPQPPKQLDKKLVTTIVLIIVAIGISYIAFKQSHLKQQVVSQDVIYGQPAEDLCGPQPPAECGMNMRLGCRLADKKWGCYPFSPEINVSTKISLSADNKNIISEGKVLLTIDDEAIFNFFKTKSQLCDEYNITTTPDRKTFCENKTTFKNETRFKSIVVSSDEKKVGFTIESDTLSPDTVVGIFYPYNTTNKVNLLSDYYLGNEFLSFSPSGADFVYSSGCWEAACAFYIKDSETLLDKINFIPQYADERGNYEFLRWISNNEIEYKLGTEVKRATLLSTTNAKSKLEELQQFESSINFNEWKNYNGGNLRFEFVYPASWILKDLTQNNNSSNNADYDISVGYISAQQRAHMGIDYCSAYSNDSKRCEIYENVQDTFIIDWQSGIASVDDKSSGGTITIGVNKLDARRKEIFYKILLNFHFVLD